MGKEAQQRNYYKIRLNNNHHQQQGRFWGMFHALDYHNWDYVKKLRHKKHVRKNRFRCCVAPRTVSFNFVNGEEHVDDESQNLLFEHDVGNNPSLEPSSSKKTHEEEIIQDLVISNPVLIFHSVSHLRLNNEQSNRRLNKVRSFPAPKPVSLGTKLYRSSTMDHKKNEIWSFPKGEKLNIVTFDSPKRNKSLQFGETMKDSTLKHGWKINPFKSFKNKIKRALQEIQTEEIKDIGINKTKQTSITRLSSLYESIDKYTRLFEGSYGNEASKLDHAKSLKLASKVRNNVHKSLRRRISLPNYETLDSLLADESHENLQSRHKNLRSGSLTNAVSKDSNCVETVDEDEFNSIIDFVEDSLDGSEIEIDLNAELPAIRGGNEGECATIDDHCDEGVIEARNVEKLAKPMCELQPSSPDSVLVPFSPLQDSTTSGTTNFDNLTEIRYDPGKEDNPDFKFITEILNSAEFYENELIPTWDSIQLPLNPTSYDERDWSEDRELMFDLINEALLEIYQRSYSYFPRPLSFSPCTRPVTKGKHVIDEVWRIVTFYKDMKPELDVSLDNIVARDMARHDGWVNPCGLDNECVALELEELILNELVDELIDVLH